MIDVLQLYRIDSYNYNDVVDDVFDDKVHDHWEFKLRRLRVTVGVALPNI